MRDIFSHPSLDPHWLAKKAELTRSGLLNLQISVEELESEVNCYLFRVVKEIFVMLISL